MRLQIAKLHQDLQTTMVYVTHDQVEAMTLADKIVVLHDGIVEQVGSPLDLYHRPNNLFVAGFIGSPRMNFVPVTAVSVENNKIGFKLPDEQIIALPVKRVNNVRIGDKLTFGIRPEHLVVGSGNELTFKFNSEVVERLGNSTYLFGQYAGIDSIKVHLPGDQEVHKFTEINLCGNFADCHLFDSEEQCLTS